MASFWQKIIYYYRKKCIGYRKLLLSTWVFLSYSTGLNTCCGRVFLEGILG
jgi:hypothetical protein